MKEWRNMMAVIVKKLLLASQSNIKNSTRGVLFYSVPHLGSPIATQSEKAQFILFPSVEVNNLSESSEDLRHLHHNFLKLVKTNRIKCVDFGESRPLSLPYIKLKSIT